MDYGTKLRSLRLRVNLSQGEVAKELGFSTAQSISNIERGICRFSLKHLNKLSDLYDTKLMTLFNLHMKDMRREALEVING